METKIKLGGYGSATVCCNDSQVSVKTFAGDLIRVATDCVTQNRVAACSKGVDENGCEQIACVPLLETLPAYEGGKIIGIYDCGDGCWQVLGECDEAAKAEAYWNTLSEAGFENLNETVMNETIFRQYRKDDVVLHVLYTPSLTALRIVAESAETAVISEKEPKPFEKICTTKLTQIGLGCDAPGRVFDDHENDISMSYVLRLCDGRFIVWDGGMPWPEYEERLLRVLNDQNVLEGKPVIALWVLTHAHPDHTGIFDVFANKHLDDVTVENVMHNFHSDYQCGEWLKNYHRALRGFIRKFGAKTLKAHSGCELYFADARIQVLYEHELMAPRPIVNLNTASLVTRVYVEGMSMLFLADHADCTGSEKYPHFNNGAIRGLYGDYLKSDFVQVAHHGLGGGCSRKLYEIVQAKYVLWPIGEAKFLFHKMGENSTNSVFKNPELLVCHAFQRIYVFDWLEEGMKWKAYTSFEEYKARMEAGK